MQHSTRSSAHSTQYTQYHSKKNKKKKHLEHTYNPCNTSTTHATHLQPVQHTYNPCNTPTTHATFRTHHASEFIGAASKLPFSQKQDDVAESSGMFLHELVVSDGYQVPLQGLSPNLQSLRVKLVEGRQTGQTERGWEIIHLQM